jgi:hypothetical protein
MPKVDNQHVTVVFVIVGRIVACGMDKGRVQSQQFANLPRSTIIVVAHLNPTIGWYFQSQMRCQDKVATVAVGLDASTGRLSGKTHTADGQWNVQSLQQSIRLWKFLTNFGIPRAEAMMSCLLWKYIKMRVRFEDGG